MPAPEVNQPKAQAMDVPSAQAIQEQPKPVGKMTVEEPVGMRGGGAEGLCCGLCAGFACFECLNCCC
ncbi:hypothetical protein GMDG_04613 [Pseudogymnoascus destructans 20631-21]|uniref:Cysteine-rich transmembrane CYSTM domain-containing protein n=1 Tax=Pseudogymnoascus destructans (strain ATCC MYA-4855 / 20631-21) TaxID=658429 RepID=L8GBI3_PSED2|nr:hypothetical protein GMDG_04613 [Pseudogymnoascus destructans 20631-21]